MDEQGSAKTNKLSGGSVKHLLSAFLLSKNKSELCLFCTAGDAPTKGTWTTR